VLKKLINSGSRLVVLPYQDLFGLPDRINTPNTLGPHNWSFRPDAPLEKFAARHRARLALLAGWVKETSR
jgi:4-alpha-glucanotransferase